MLEIARLAGRSNHASGCQPDPETERVLTLITPGPGTYVLILCVAQDGYIPIGSLGKHHVPRGCYAYVGSAFGPGGLRARLTHHVKAASKPHWHVDYLRRQAEIVEIWYSPLPIKQEHVWARISRSTRDVTIAVLRFGASDCQCASHLFWFPEPVRGNLFRRLDSADLLD